MTGGLPLNVIFGLHLSDETVFPFRMPRPKQNFSDISALSKRADALIADLEKEKVALRKQIEGVQRKIEEKDLEIGDLQAAKRALPLMTAIKRVGRPPGRPKSSAQPTPDNTNTQTDSSPKSTSSEVPPEGQSMAGLIRKLALSQTGRFTPSTINDLMRAQYPEVFKRLPKNYTNSNLWRLADSKKKPIRIVESGGPGGANVYEVNSKSTSAGA